MHMAIATREWTVEEVWALPEDGNRYEVIDGELFVTASPRRVHQDGAFELAMMLQSYLRPLRIGRAYTAPSDVLWGPRTLVQPDVYVTPLVGGRIPKDWNQLGRLLLAVEVLSASSARADRNVKRRLYLDSGVPEYWIVDMDARLIERWRSGDSRPEIVTERLEWQPDASQPPFVLELASFFARIPEDE
jgi:Uma2 family endonuclease